MGSGIRRHRCMRDSGSRFRGSGTASAPDGAEDVRARSLHDPGQSGTEVSGTGPLPVPGRVREIGSPDVLAEWAEGSLAVTTGALTTSDETVLANLLEHRRSCRAYLPDQVPRDVIERILGAAELTPSCATPSHGTCTLLRARRLTAFEGRCRLMFKPTRCRSRIPVPERL